MGHGLGRWIAGTAVLVVGAAGWVAFSSGRKPPIEEPVGDRVDRHGDSLPPGAVLRLGTLRYRAGAHAATGLVVADDGRSVWTGFNERRLVQIDLETGARLRLLRGHREHVRIPGYSPDWEDILKRRPRRDIVPDSFAWLFRGPEAGSLVSAGVTLRRTDVASGESEILHTADRWLSAATASDDGRWVAVGDTQHLRVLEVATGQILMEQPLRARRGASVAWEPGGSRIAWKESDAISTAVHVIDVDDDEADVVSHDLPKANLRLRAWLPAGRLLLYETGAYRLASAADGGDLGVLPAASAKTAPRHPHAAGPPVVSPDGATLVVPWHHALEIHDLAGDAPLRVLGTPEGAVWGAAFSPDGSQLVTHSSGGAITVYGTASWTVRSTAEGHAGSLLLVRVAADGQTVVTAGSTRLREWSLDDSRPLRHISRRSVRALALDDATGDIVTFDGSAVVRHGVAGAPSTVATLTDVRALSSGGRRALVQARSGQAEPPAPVRVIDVASGATIWEQPQSGPYAHGAFASESSVVVVRHGELISAVNTDTETEWRVPGVFATNVVAISPDGALVAHGGQAQRAGWVRLLRVGDGVLFESLTAWPDAGQGCSALAFSPDGSLIAGAGGNGVIHLWDTSTGDLVGTARGHLGNVGGLAFTPDGDRLVSVSDDTTGLVWDVAELRKAGPN